MFKQFMDDCNICVVGSLSVTGSELPRRGRWTKGQSDGHWPGRRPRHIWPALRRNLIFNLRTVGHMRLLKQRRYVVVASWPASWTGQGWPWSGHQPDGCRLKLLAHVACRQIQRRCHLWRFIYSALSDW